MLLSIIDPERSPAGRFKQGRVSYGGRKYRVAVVAVGSSVTQLGLADTGRCAVDLEAARATVQALVKGAEVHASENEVMGAAHALQTHCRQITGWKPREPRR